MTSANGYDVPSINAPSGDRFEFPAETYVIRRVTAVDDEELPGAIP
jgi:hypothetical protein